MDVRTYAAVRRGAPTSVVAATPTALIYEGSRTHGACGTPRDARAPRPSLAPGGVPASAAAAARPQLVAFGVERTSGRPFNARRGAAIAARAAPPRRQATPPLFGTVVERRAADVVVIGGGVLAASAAYSLARRGKKAS
eukprot:365608-Chlamydomonas_euryale.AAC.32